MLPEPCHWKRGHRSQQDWEDALAGFFSGDPPITMSAPPSNQRHVSLRGASVKEITRDDLLEKLARERELRSYHRRASTSALFIQRVWQRYKVTKRVTDQLREDWETLADNHNDNMTGSSISKDLLRPFLFFVTKTSTLHGKLQKRNVKCMTTCFRVLLQSINSADPEKNFCLLAVGTELEKSTWLYQAQKLVSLCLFILAECDDSIHEGEILPLTALAMRLIVSLTDIKGWKGLQAVNVRDADTASKKLIGYMTTSKNGIYSCLRSYLLNHGPLSGSQKKCIALSDNHILIIASAVNLALRPFHTKKDVNDAAIFDVFDASQWYFVFVITIPYLSQCLPSALLPALQYKYAFLPCLSTLLISKDNIFEEISKFKHSENSKLCPALIPPLGWALANIINLAIDHKGNTSSSGCFVEHLDCRLYVHAVNCISENFLKWLEDNIVMAKQDGDNSLTSENFLETVESESYANLKLSYIELLRPVHQQWHLRKLLTATQMKFAVEVPKVCGMDQVLECYENFKLINVIYFYYHMLRIFSYLNPVVGSLPILNVLSFTPGFLIELWEALEKSIGFSIGDVSQEIRINEHSASESHGSTVLDTKLDRNIKDSGSKWANVLQKITGKSTTDRLTYSREEPSTSAQSKEDDLDKWDIEAMRQGSHGISRDMLSMLHLFCAIYSHLLLVLDDIEFYEKQVHFTLKQQRTIAAVLNTFVYNSFILNGGNSNRPVLDVAVRCLHLLYERDCRHKFCPSFLWLAPARKGRIPIAVAARVHEAAFADSRCANASSMQTLSSVLTTVPHVYPFEERVQMFREFIKQDKSSRRLAVEVSGPGSGSIEIVVRRDHIVEDGYKQLNFLGSRLKSSINVSFVNECGLPEAGLDYGGLSKEFLTDLSKAAFDPGCGLFCQTSTSENSLIPNMAAKLLENGIEMIEFLGRVTGKALYEGILLDYSFSLVFVQKLLGRYSFLDELSTLDAELYRNLVYVKHYDGDVGELSLDFTVTEDICGKKIVTDLKPGGRNVTVTNENKLQYVHAMADYKLNRQILPFANAFYRGLIDLISPSWLSLFNANEFNQLLSGGKHDFDVDDLRCHTKYSGGYSETSRTIRLLWEVITGFSPNERCMLLKFVTSCSRAPLLGFKYLQPAFTIHKVTCDIPIWAALGGQDVDRLPSASTCYNTLKLPTYKRASTLRSKLLYAISSNTGFELS